MDEANKQAILDALDNSEPEIFVSEHLLEPIPAIFSGNIVEYVHWKLKLASLLAVDPTAIKIIGSACLGVSLNPRKNYTIFHADSDIDVAIISSYHFEVAWQWMRNLSSVRLASLPSDTRDKLKSHRKNYIFEGVIATDLIIDYLPFASEWVNASIHMKTLSPTEDRDVKFRLYRDFSALRTYHLKNTQELRNSRAGGEM